MYINYYRKKLKVFWDDKGTGIRKLVDNFKFKEAEKLLERSNFISVSDERKIDDYRGVIWDCIKIELS